MSFKKFETRLDLELKPSRYLLICVVTIHLLALWVCVMGLAIQPLLLIFLALCIMISLALTLKNNFSIEVSRYLEKIIYLDGMDLILVYSNNHEEQVTLLAQWFVLSWITILHVTLNNGKTSSIILLPDMLSAKQFRLLRIRLKRLVIKIKKSADNE